MTSVFARPRGRTLTRTALSVAATGTLLFGLAAPASASSGGAASASSVGAAGSCLQFKHSKPFFGKTQTVTGTNTCGVTRGFKVHNWGPLPFNHEYSPCLQVEPGRSTAWKWTKGRGKYEITLC